MTSARVRIRWEARPSVDYVVRSAKGRSIRFESDGALPPPGTKGAFELRDVDGRTIAEGTLQLAFVQGSEAGAQVLDGHKVVARPKSVDVALDDLPVPDLPVPEDLPPPAPPEASVVVEAQPARDSRPESDEARVARVATRIRGKGASEGFTIGIDLGTSNTCVSIVENGRPRVLPTRTGASTVPSVLAIVDGQVRVGQAAAKRLAGLHLPPRKFPPAGVHLALRPLREEERPVGALDDGGDDLHGHFFFAFLPAQSRANW